jgi:hypothetical protein
MFGKQFVRFAVLKKEAVRSSEWLWSMKKQPVP